MARRLQERYGGSEAKSGEPRYIVKPMNEIDRLIFNTSRPPFSSARLRRAASYALDRTALAREGLFTGLPGQPTDQHRHRRWRDFATRGSIPFDRISRGAPACRPGRRSVVLYSAAFRPMPASPRS